MPILMSSLDIMPTDSILGARGLLILRIWPTVQLIVGAPPSSVKGMDVQRTYGGMGGQMDGYIDECLSIFSDPPFGLFK